VPTNGITLSDRRVAERTRAEPFCMPAAVCPDAASFAPNRSIRAHQESLLLDTWLRRSRPGQSFESSERLELERTVKRCLEARPRVLPKTYARRGLDVRRLGELIGSSPASALAAGEYCEEDILGRVYEYFLGRFTSAEGKGGGESAAREPNRCGAAAAPDRAYALRACARCSPSAKSSTIHATAAAHHDDAGARQNLPGTGVSAW
jgi:hypothetical protein